MRFKIYTNETFDKTREYCPFVNGYRIGAYMKLAYEAVFSDPFDGHWSVLESLFYTFNMDHPADYRAHSLSVGDVVVLIDSTDQEYAYACQSVGWTLLESFRPEFQSADWMTYDDAARVKGVL